MPLTKKGDKIMANMKKEYGPEEGKRVFYASRNKGKIKGVDPESSKGSKHTHRGSHEPRPKAHKYARNRRLEKERL